MEVVLHLCGSWRRAEKAAEVALSIKGDYVIVVSSEGSEAKFRKIYEDAGIPSHKVIHHTGAWDTVTNFTHTRELLTRMGVKKIHVVTTGWHMPRSIGIAKAVWFGRGVELVSASYAPEQVRDESRYTLADKIRAWAWRFTGILFYYGSVAKARNAGDSLIKHSWLEIDIDGFSGILGFLGVYNG
jgi:uncharacterized SAM-binding protein YcdF (DUF218 family)